MEKLWPLREIEEQFQVSYRTLWRWGRDGRMRVVRLPGGQLRVKDSEIQRILEGESVSV